MSPSQKSLRLHLAIGIPLFIVAAFLDVWMTLRGLNGNPYWEGNHYYRFWMAWLGLRWGLVVGKTVVGLLAIAIAIWTAHTIEHGQLDNQQRTLVPSFISWIKRSKPYWIGCVPLYIMVFFQLIAAWLWVPVVQ